jgi:DNA-directed RNA polymerase subunit K/omega
MALLNIFRKRGKTKGPISESNPHSADPMAAFKDAREPYGFEKLSMEQRESIGNTEAEAAERANNTEAEHAHIQAYLNPREEHDDAIINEANRNIDENQREVGTRINILNNVSIQDADRMHKANNAAHRARQRAAGVPEHDIMDMERGFEVSGDAISRLKAGKPPKLSNK